MKTATESFHSVQSSAESIKSDDTQRFPEAASAGDTFRQGDIYIEKIAAVPASAERVRKPDAQLAPGTTKGSRHVLDSLDGVTMYRVANPSPLDGPIIDVATEREVTHPEHGNVILPAGVYAITYQRAWADEIRRVAD